MLRTIFLCVVFFVLGAVTAIFYCLGYVSKNTEMEKVGLGFSAVMIVIAILIIVIIKGYEDRIRKHKEEDQTGNLNKS